MRLSKQLQEAVSKRTFVVYRLGSGGGLGNSNAGNVEAVIKHLDDMVEKQVAHGETISVHRITADGPFGEYTKFMGARKQHRDIGQVERVGYLKKGSSNWPEEVYSFPKGGAWTEKKLKSVSLKQLDKFSRKHGSTEERGRKLLDYERGFSARGWIEQRRLLRKALGV